MRGIWERLVPLSKISYAKKNKTTVSIFSSIHPKKGQFVKKRPIENGVRYLLAPTGALLVMMVFYISAAAPTFSVFHSVH